MIILSLDRNSQRENPDEERDFFGEDDFRVDFFDAPPCESANFFTFEVLDFLGILTFFNEQKYNKYDIRTFRLRDLYKHRNVRKKPSGKIFLANKNVFLRKIFEV